MEYIQKKTADKAVEHFLPIAADKEISLAWDRYEGQLPECGFCEAGLTCRDCLQGPCISHPFRDQNKLGVCGKDKDLLAAQSLLRLAIKGTMTCLDQVSNFIGDLGTGGMDPKDKGGAEEVIRETKELLEKGHSDAMNAFPKSLVEAWQALGIRPQGLARDLFKASQKLDGGVTSMEDTLLWAFRSSLLGCMAQRLHERLKRCVFGVSAPTSLEVNLGVLRQETPIILLYGYFSPVLKFRIAEASKKNGVSVMAVCSDPLLPPYTFPLATSYGSQEIPLMTGAVDLIVAGDHYVNPALENVAKQWNVRIVPTEGLKGATDLTAFAEQIMDQAQKSFETRRNIPRDIPEERESGLFGYSAENLELRKVVEGLDGGKIRGIALIGGSNNVKYTQDYEFVSMAREFLRNDILCISEGEASVSLAKYGLLNPSTRDENCGAGLLELLASLGKAVPGIIDCGITDFLLGLAQADRKPLKDRPIVACFSEANRSVEVVRAMGCVAMGVSTYFWPSLPVTGSMKMVKALSDFCNEKLGAKLHVITKQMEASAKSELFLKEVMGVSSISGKPW